MKSIVEEKLVSFKALEQKVFAYVCELGREITRTMLESYDAELAKGRDRQAYRDKGPRTTIKTVYGEVTYARRVYRTKLADGRKAYVYLLDEAMRMDKIGLFSTNMAEKIAMAATEAPYRVAAETVGGACGQSVSHGGAWALMQRLGERICEEGSRAVEEMEAGRAKGAAAPPVLFEEMDGVWLPMQDGRHRKMKKREMKVFTMYEGWDAGGKGRSRLVNKTVFAGMEGSGEFHAKREAAIERKYDVDEIRQRVLNGDGGGWVNEPYDAEAIFQLDRYHIHQGILQKTSDKGTREDIRGLLEAGKPDEMLECIRAYADRAPEDGGQGKEREKALELYGYLSNNREGLLPYQERGIKIPEPPEGVVYKNMGVQENQNCTVITLRMKHRRMRWSVDGANNMAKALYRKENGEPAETIGRHTDGLIHPMRMQEALKTLSAAKAPKKDGKGDPYADKINSHMPLRDALRTASRKAFLAALSH